MVYLAHPYQFLILLIQDLESGTSVRLAVKNYLLKHQNDFAADLVSWFENTQREQKRPSNAKNPHRQALFDVLDLALQGGSVLPHLYELENEFKFACEQNLEDHLAKLPYKLMIPLLLFQFPAFLVLILGPLLSQLISEVQ
jgi:hypothetical protein